MPCKACHSVKTTALPTADDVLDRQPPSEAASVAEANAAADPPEAGTFAAATRVLLLWDVDNLTPPGGAAGAKLWARTLKVPPHRALACRDESRCALQ